jgi:hypothetical protein
MALHTLSNASNHTAGWKTNFSQQVTLRGSAWRYLPINHGTPRLARARSCSSIPICANTIGIEARTADSLLYVPYSGHCRIWLANPQIIPSADIAQQFDRFEPYPICLPGACRTYRSRPHIDYSRSTHGTCSRGKNQAMWPSRLS